MTETVPSDTPVDAILGKTIQFNGSDVTVTRQRTGDGLERYQIEWGGDNIPAGERVQSRSRILIGCPECKENQHAQFMNSGYKCPCGYFNELNVATLLNPSY